MPHRTTPVLLLASVLLAVGTPAGLRAQTGTCPSFSNLPVNVSNDPGFSFTPQLGVTDLGTVNLTWHDGTGLSHARSTDQGQTFSAPTAIPGTGSASVEPRMAAETSRLHIVYTVGSGSTSTIAHRMSTDGGATWSSQMTISTAGETSPSGPAVGAHCGRVYVAYHGIPTGDTETDVFLSSSSDGGQTFGPPINVSQSPGVKSLRPDVAVRETGMTIQDVLVAWQERGASPDVRSRTSTDSAATFAPPVIMGSLLTPAGASEPRLDVDPQTGAVVATWSDIPGPLVQGDVFATTSTDGGMTFGAVQNLTNTPSVPTRAPCPTFYGSRIHIGYEEADTGPFELKQVCSVDLTLTNLTPPQQISGTPGIQSTNIDLAFTGDHLLIAYEDTTPTNTAPDVVVDRASVHAQLQTMPGTGCTGSQGVVPTFGATGDFLGSFTLSVGPVQPGAAGVLAVSTSLAITPIPVGSCFVDVDLDPANTTLLPIAAGATGEWSVTLSGPLPSPFMMYVQAGFDEGALGFTVSEVAMLRTILQ